MANTKYTSSSSSNKRNAVQFVFRHLKLIIFGIVSIAVTAFAFVIWQQTKAGVISLLNADIEVLKSAFFGEKPYVYYCHERGNLDYIPPKLADAHKMMGPKYGLAILNCSQELPSGKTIADRFKLKKEWNPMIFATAPWAKPSQVAPRSLKESKSMAEYLLYSLKPKPIRVGSDKEFKEACGFSSGKEENNKVCFVVSMGSRYADGQEAMVNKMVEQFHKNRILLVDSKVRRFSHEKSDPSSNPDNYAMRVVAVRNGSGYVTMPNAPTWSNIEAFMTNSLKASSEKFTVPSSGEVTLVKPSSPSSTPKKDSTKTKRKSPKPNPKASQKSSATSSSNAKDATDDTETSAPASFGSSQEGMFSDDAEKEKAMEAEVERERVRRERLRREAMDRESREYLFEYDEDEAELADEEGEEWAENNMFCNDQKEGSEYCSSRGKTGGGRTKENVVHDEDEEDDEDDKNSNAVHSSEDEDHDIIEL